MTFDFFAYQHHAIPLVLYEDEEDPNDLSDDFEDDVQAMLNNPPIHQRIDVSILNNLFRKKK